MSLAQLGFPWAEQEVIQEMIMTELNPIIYMYHISIHSSVDGHLGCFHVLTIVNSAAVNIESACIFLNYGHVWVYAQEWDCWILW